VRNDAAGAAAAAAATSDQRLPAPVKGRLHVSENDMDRRTWITGTIGATAAVATPLAAAQDMPTIRWRMPSSFPKSLDTVYGGAVAISEHVKRLTGGKFTITPFGAGELVPPLAILDAVQDKTVECGHTAGFYYVGKESALVFDTGVPFGMTPRQHTGWMMQGGGMELMREVYARFGVIQIPCGNTGAQMGGWFRKEIKKAEDLQGLRIRTPGFLGKVYAKLGATALALPASDIYPTLEKGTIDAVEWVGPYDDEKLGLSKVTKFYYGPGVMELGASLCFLVNKEAWQALPDAYRAALDGACALAQNEMLAKYDTHNVVALKKLVAGGTKLGFWPQSVMEAMRRATNEVIEEESSNELFRKVHAHWRAYLDDQLLWASINDGAAEQFVLSARRKS
jgi:TRAP-type mannitol/chloroaromatic compound transport system substrate-binding protein